MKPASTAPFVTIVSRVSRKNWSNYALLNAKSGRASGTYKRKVLNTTLFLLLVLANLLPRSRPVPKQTRRIQVTWSRHGILEFSSAQILSWHYTYLRLPVALTLSEFWAVIKLAQEAKAHLGAEGRDTLMIALEVVVWQKVLTLYTPQTIIHNGTICRRSYIISEMAPEGVEIYVLQHGYLTYPTEIEAPRVRGFFRDEKFPEQAFEDFLNISEPSRVRSCAFSKSRWKTVPPADRAMALALTPNDVLSNLRLIGMAARNGAKFTKIFLYLHPRQSRFFYKVIARLYPKCEVTSDRHRNLDTLITFPSSIIMEFANTSAHIYMVTYLIQSKPNPKFEALAQTIDTAQKLKKALTC